MKNNVINELHQKIVNKVIDNLHKYKNLWGKGYSNLIPKNYVSNKNYSGINQFQLSLIESKDARWITFSQAIENNLKIKKGSKSEKILFCDYSKEELTEYDYQKIIHTKEYLNGKINIIIDPTTGQKFLQKNIKKVFNVFNCENVEGVNKVKEQDNITDEKLNFLIDKIVELSPVKIEFFDILESPRFEINLETNEERILLPTKKIVDSTEILFSILIHELIHSTGTKARLNREKFNGKYEFGSKEYGREELIACLGQMFVCQEYNIKNIEENHQLYIDSWIRLFNDSSDELVKAATKASRAVQWLKENIFSKININNHCIASENYEQLTIFDNF